MFLGRNIAKVTFYGKSHLSSGDAEVVLVAASNPGQISVANKTRTALPLDPPQISHLQELIVKWIDGRRTFVFFHLFHEKKKKKKKSRAGRSPLPLRRSDSEEESFHRTFQQQRYHLKCVL